MATCLEDLNVTLQALQTALENINIAVNNSATADTDIEVHLQSSSQALLSQATTIEINNLVFAYATAQAQAQALNLTVIEFPPNVVSREVPPVSKIIPPPLTIYPESETGISATVITSNTELCQRAYYLVDSVLEVLTRISAAFDYTPVGLILSGLGNMIEGAIKAAVYLAGKAGFVLPKQSVSALMALMAMYSVPGGTLVVDDLITALQNATDFLALQRDTIALAIYCDAVANEDTEQMIAGLAGTLQTLDDQAAALIAIFFNRAALAAVMFDTTLFATPSTTENCACE